MIPPEDGPQTLEDADAALTTVTEDPETPEAPADEAATEGPPRDEQGRFTSTAPEPEPTPDPGTPAAPETPGEPAPVEPEPEPEYDEFHYRVNGQEFAIPGSAVGDDGVFFRHEDLPVIQQYVSTGRWFETEGRQRLSAADQRAHANQKRAEAAEQQYQHILAHVEGLIERNELGPWLENVRQNWPILKAEARAKGLELQAQAERDELQRYRQGEQERAREPLIGQAIEQSVLQFGQDVGLDATQMSEVYQYLADPQMRSHVIVPAPFDDPMGRFKRGELVVDHGMVQREIARVASLSRQFGRPASAPPPRPAPAPVKPPPAVSGRGTRAPSPRAPQFSSAKEADEFLLNGNLDELLVE